MPLIIVATLVAAASGNEVPDIRSVEPDLVVPEMVEDDPGPGRRVKQTTAGYEDTKVYHALYLPVDWQPKKRYPVIVEYAGNGPFTSPYGDVSTGKVEGSSMGYGISGGKGVIWVCMPYLNNAAAANVTMWWGSGGWRGKRSEYKVQPTIDYCMATVKMICERYGGDSTNVFIAGFSRGSIACNYIGLHNDEIASLWRGFICYANYDGKYPSWPYPGADRASATKRLQRLGQRPQFICGGVPRKAKDAFSVTRAYLKQAYPDGKFTFELIPFRNHNDAWTLRDIPSRRALRKWFAAVLAAGTAGAAESTPKELMTPNKRLAKATGLPGEGTHDPSNIIRHDGLYYCWYTDHIPPIVGINTRIRLITSPDGVAWTERGVVLEPDKQNDWEALGTLTAYVVEHQRRFYMFYTARPKGYKGWRADGKKSCIALAVADDPMGPWKKKGPVFQVSKDGWDRQHVDDANVVRHKGRWLLYYKGFTEKLKHPKGTKLGLATATKLTGPYTRHDGNPIMTGHAFSAWKHRDGIALVTGGNGKQVVFWSTDGVKFVPTGSFKNRSTGFYVPEGNFTDKPNNQGVTWGMDVKPKRRLSKFECHLGVANKPDNEKK